MLLHAALLLDLATLSLIMILPLIKKLGDLLPDPDGPSPGPVNPIMPNSVLDVIRAKKDADTAESAAFVVYAAARQATADANAALKAAIDAHGPVYVMGDSVEVWIADTGEAVGFRSFSPSNAATTSLVVATDPANGSVTVAGPP